MIRVCRSCAKEFDSELKNCPHCGARKKRFRFKDFLKSYLLTHKISCSFFAKVNGFTTLKVLSWRYLGLSPNSFEMLKITNNSTCKIECILGFKSVSPIEVPQEIQLEVQKMLKENSLWSDIKSSI